MIQVKNVSFSYEKKQVLHDLSFSIPKGKITTILGQNGCGKSTILGLMTKNRKVQQGEIMVQERNLKSYSLREFSRLAAVVAQYNTAPESITVEQLVAYGRLPYFGMPKERKEDRACIQRALQVTNLMDIRGEQVSKLSGGQMQRVWIAMAIAQNTKVLFLDEPTTYLDIYYQLEVLKLIKELNETLGLTIVMILHDLNQAIHYSDHIVALKGGKTYFEGTPQEFVKDEHIQEIYHVDLKLLFYEGKQYALTI